MRGHREGARRSRPPHAVVLLDRVLHSIALVNRVPLDFGEVMPDEVAYDVFSDLIWIIVTGRRGRWSPRRGIRRRAR